VNLEALLFRIVQWCVLVNGALWVVYGALWCSVKAVDRIINWLGFYAALADWIFHRDEFKKWNSARTKRAAAPAGEPKGSK